MKAQIFQKPINLQSFLRLYDCSTVSVFRFLLILIFTFGFLNYNYAQGGIDFECGVSDPNIHEMIMLRYQVSAIQNFQPPGGATSASIPVHFTILRDNNGVTDVTSVEVTAGLAELNTKFSNLGWNFFQCGQITFVDGIKLNEYSPCSSDPIVSNIGELYSASHVSTALNVYIMKSTKFGCLPVAGLATLPWSSGPNQNHVMVIEGVFPNEFDIFVHEIGHYFGLLHTSVNAGQGNPAFEELVIRDPDQTGTKPFPIPNCDDAGDLLCNTPASCIASPLFSNCTVNTTNCTYTGTATDLNGDFYTPDVSDYMNRGVGFCRDNFVLGQTDRMNFYYLHPTEGRAQYLRDDLCDNVIDKVEFEGGNTGLKNVAVNLTLPQVTLSLPNNMVINEFCNTTTNSSGDMRCSLDENQQITADVTKRGSNDDWTYTNADWTCGVTTADLVLIQKHILVIDSLSDGYKMIAADANNDGEIKTSDITLIQQLILGIINDFPGFESPWRFVPEYIPQTFASTFNTDPFLDDPNTFNYPFYLGPGWVYNLTNGSSGMNGFDGIKIGDVNESSLTQCSGLKNFGGGCENSFALTTQVPDISLSRGEIIEIPFRVRNFSGITAYQLGMEINSGDLQLMEIVKGELPGLKVADDFGKTRLPFNEFRTLWYDETGKTLSLLNETTLFTLKLKALRTIPDFSRVFSFKDEILKCVFYNEKGCPANVELILGAERILNLQKPETVTIYPDPVKEEATLLFNLNEASRGVITIRSKFGQVMAVYKSNFDKGQNKFTIRNFPNLRDGLYIVSVETSSAFISGKFIKIR